MADEVSRRSRGRPWPVWVHFVVAIVDIALAQAFVVRTGRVPSSSLEPALVPGQIIAADRVSINWEPVAPGEAPRLPGMPEPTESDEAEDARPLVGALSWRISPRVAYVLGAPERVTALHLDRPADQPLAILGSGATTWSLLAPLDDGEAAPWVGHEELLSGVADAYGMPREAIRGAVEGFLQNMGEAGFLERS